MINIKSYVGDLEIIGSGNAHVTQGKKLKIEFVPVKIEFQFKKDENVELGKIDFTMENEILSIIFTNFIHPIGNGILDPWQIGAYEGKQLFMTFFSKHIEDNLGNYYLCEYIFYTGKEVENV